MKFLKQEGDFRIFHLGKREKGLLLDLLELYPVVPPAHYRITDSDRSTGWEGCQHLLDEALAEHRKENKRQLELMLRDSERFRETSSGFRFALTDAQLEWLLQVLNDIRIGSWLLLGSPDAHQGKGLSLSTENARHFWAMELSGHVQSILLAAQELS